MKPSNKRKFNKPKGKTKNFPIPQYRCIVRSTHSIYSGAKCSFKIKTILSQQEEQMLFALRNTFNVDVRDVVRIAISEVFSIAYEKVETTLPFCLALSDKQGHTARSRKYEFRIAKQDKETFENLSKLYKLSQQETVRLVIIHLEKGIRSETITRIKDGNLLSQAQAAEAYFKDRPVSSGKLNALKKARDEAKKDKMQREKELYDRRGDMIDYLIKIGDPIPRGLDDKIDINYIDQKLEEEFNELNEFAFGEYLETVLADQLLDEKEIRIQRELFALQRLNLSASQDNYPTFTREDVIEMLAEQDRIKEETEAPLTEEEEQEYISFMQEVEDNWDENTERINPETALKNSSVFRRARRHITPRAGQSFDEALKEQLDRTKRIAEQGLTKEETDKLVKDYLDRHEEWADELRESTDHD